MNLPTLGSRADPACSRKARRSSLVMADMPSRSASWRAAEGSSAARLRSADRALRGHCLLASGPHALDRAPVIAARVRHLQQAHLALLGDHRFAVLDEVDCDLDATSIVRSVDKLNRLAARVVETNHAQLLQ